jgi:hypothetical protein
MGNETGQGTKRVRTICQATKIVLTRFSFKGSPGERALKIGPGETLVRHLTFDLAALGVPSDGGWNVRMSPKDTLLEINDRISGQKVWCALTSGYPPGTDIMRWATVVKDPKSTSDNLPKDEANSYK